MACLKATPRTLLAAPEWPSIWCLLMLAGIVSGSKYVPTIDGAEDIYSNRLRFTLKGVTSYKNLVGAYRNRVSAPDYLEWVTADNVGTYFAGAGDDGVIARGLLVGTSLNSLTPYPIVWPGDSPSAFATYHSTFSMRDNTLINFPFVEGKSSGAFKTDDYYLTAVDKGSVRNSNNKLLATDSGSTGPLLPIWTADLWRIATGRMQERSGTRMDIGGPKQNYWVYDLPFLTAGANCLWVQPAGKNGKSCAGQYYGVVGYQTDFDSGRYTFQAPIEATRVDANGNEIGRWSVGRRRRIHQAAEHAPLCGPARRTLCPPISG